MGAGGNGGWTTSLSGVVASVTYSIVGNLAVPQSAGYSTAGMIYTGATTATANQRVENRRGRHSIRERFLDELQHQHCLVAKPISSGTPARAQRARSWGQLSGR